MDPNKRNVGGIDSSDGKRNFGSSTGQGKGSWVDHGGRSISRAPSAGERSGVSRSDGPYRRGSGKPERY